MDEGKRGKPFQIERQEEERAEKKTTAENNKNKMLFWRPDIVSTHAYYPHV